MIRVIYPGTFDPITFGHIDIIQRATRIFEKILVAVAASTTKNTTFTVEERVEMVSTEIKSLQLSNVVQVMSFHGLLVDFARAQNITVILRGMRALADFEYEFQMAYVNKKLYHTIETVFLPATEQGHFISSSFVKEVARLNGNLSNLVSCNVAAMLMKRFSPYTLNK